MRTPIVRHIEATLSEGSPTRVHLTDADMEPCFPVKPAAKQSSGITIRELPTGRCVTLLHQGPYEELGRSYEKVFAYVEQHGYKTPFDQFSNVGIRSGIGWPPLCERCSSFTRWFGVANGSCG